MYRPGFVGLGLLESGIEVAVAGAADGGVPSLTLTLEEHGEGIGEFSTYTVGNGCMAGVAQSGGTETPFVARLTGNLNCRTGKFEGLLNGHYTLVGVPGLDFQFTGPLTAQFGAEPARLENGVWRIMEPPALLGGGPAGGGEGTWAATLQAAAAPDAGEDPCQGIAAAQTSDAGADSGAGR